MRRFRDLAIGHKLMLAMMLTSSAAVLLAGITRIIYEVTAFRNASARDLSVQAEIIGENSAAALEFDNPQTAQETLASLKARTDIVAACIARTAASWPAMFVAPTHPRRRSRNWRLKATDWKAVISYCSVASHARASGWERFICGPTCSSITPV